MRAKPVNEEINFERDQDPMKAMGVGKNRFIKKGDTRINDKFVFRSRPYPNDNSVTIVNIETGKSINIGLFAAREVIEALKELT